MANKLKPTRKENLGEIDQRIRHQTGSDAKKKLKALGLKPRKHVRFLRADSRTEFSVDEPFQSAEKDQLLIDEFNQRRNRKPLNPIN